MIHFLFHLFSSFRHFLSTFKEILINSFHRNFINKFHEIYETSKFGNTVRILISLIIIFIIFIFLFLPRNFIEIKIIFNNKIKIAQTIREILYLNLQSSYILIRLFSGNILFFDKTIHCLIGFVQLIRTIFNAIF